LRGGYCGGFAGVAIMFKGRTVFAQLLDFVPHKHFEYLVQKSSANRWTKTLPAWSHFVCLAYAQITRREGLRDLVACLNSHRSRLYHLGVRHRISRSTLADASERRDWHLFESLGQRLIAQALDLHRQEAHPLGLQEPLYAMDSTVIDLCLALFPWAEFRQTKAAVKVHTVIDLRGCIPVFLSITEGRVSDINLLAEISLPAHATVVLDRGYIDFAKLHSLSQRDINFVVRSRDNLRHRVLLAHEVDQSTGLRADERITLTHRKSHLAYPEDLRRVQFYDEVHRVDLAFLTNRWDLPALTIAQIYKQRWRIELFFKWLKQNLSVRHFFGNSVNAVKSQIWIAVCVYLTALLAHKTLKLDLSLQLLLHLIEVNMFEKITLQDMVQYAQSNDPDPALDYQLELL
jgi:hypothetical protein